MAVDAAGLAQLVRMLGLSIPKDALERLAPAVARIYADLERLRELPIDGRVPALPPLAPAASRCSADDGRSDVTRPTETGR